ncbi:phage portal protein [Kitasatospora sp. CB01950]|uniref:phage portal protein n=1 Tax=Kitasatospora sp. CB01950 TaxID=1703930 RepID=UPI0009393317|nr:phage portal protein [Kitasatospora sp. CB01950]
MGRLADATAALFGRRAAPAVALDSIRDRRPVSFSTGSAVTLNLDPESRGYSHSAVAYRCVAAIADNGSSIDMVVRNGEGEVIQNHWVSQLFNKRPNRFMSARVFKNVILQQGELAGQSFVYLDRGETRVGDVQGAYTIYDPVQVVVDKPAADRPTPGDILGFVVNRADGQRIALLPEEVLWLRYPHPFDPLGALAPWKAARHAVDMDAFAREWQRSSYQNGAAPTGVVYLGEMTEANYAQAKASWRAEMQGPANAGRTLLVGSPPGSNSKGVSYARVGLTAEEMDYLESRVANAAEVMLAFGVPRDYLMGQSTYDNARAAKTTLWSDTIRPKLDIIASEVDLRLLPSDAEDATWDYDSVEALQEGQDAQATRVRENVGADLLTLDEARAEIGRPPLPGGIGQQTITPYRAAFAPVASPAAGSRAVLDFDVLAAQLIERMRSEEQTARSLPTFTGEPRRELVRAADPAPAVNVQAEYDAIEGEGVAAVRRLAMEQAAAVLRDFDRLMAKPVRSTDWLAVLHGQAAALAVEGRVRLTTPDPDHVPAAEMAGVDLASGPDGWEQRIRARDLFDPRYWRRRTVEALAPFIRRAAQRGGQGITPGFDVDQTDVAQALADRAEQLAGQVTATTQRALEAQLLQHGVSEGESIPALRARLQKVFTDLSDYRAEMIARTETVGAYNQTALSAASQAGAVRKKWLATRNRETGQFDPRTRQSHRLANGDTVPLGERFTASQSRWPGDPAAPANQSINCRCTLTFEYEEN